MKKVFLLFFIVLVSVGFVFAQNSQNYDAEIEQQGQQMEGQSMDWQMQPMDGELIDGQMIDEQMMQEEEKNKEEQMLIAYDTSEKQNQKCFCDCKQGMQGESMEDGYMPMGQEMKEDDDEQGQPMEDGYVPMGQEMKEDEQDKSCKVKIAELQAHIDDLKQFISDNGLTVPETEEAKTEEIGDMPEEGEQQQNGQYNQMKEQHTQGFKGFFKKFFGFFQSSPSMTEPIKETEDTAEELV